MLRAPALLLIALAATLPARADAPDAELARLYRLALSAEMCGFAVTPKQAEAIGKAMDKRIAALKLSDEAADKLYQEIEAGMDGEGWDGLCTKGGAWEKTYQAEVRKFGR
ncbi:hypothetical protein [Prosthecomicrobium sp. N25]|uniref:hypothetical protein n=1 Tax=Prosthecomicrobium sp. N25 TaxID=3129254 RepID=UPI003076D217